VHVELLRIDERLTSIEKLLKDIEYRHGPSGIAFRLRFVRGLWHVAAWLSPDHVLPRR
jgi:hypothetical protein